jgi:hypothetical protein
MFGGKVPAARNPDARSMQSPQMRKGYCAAIRKLTRSLSRYVSNPGAKFGVDVPAWSGAAPPQSRKLPPIRRRNSRVILAVMSAHAQSSSPPARWEIFKVGARLYPLGEVEALDERAAVEVAAKLHRVPARRLVAIRCK